VPVERAVEIERATNGEFSVHDLRPDIFGPAPDTCDEQQQDARTVQRPAPGAQREDRDQAPAGEQRRGAA